MYEQIAKWVDTLPLNAIPDEVEAFCFNLYDGCDDLHWTMELVGTASFDAEDEDWACDEVTDFASREHLLRWEHAQTWEGALEQIICVLREYLEKGAFAEVLKSRVAVGVGFVDGDIEIIYEK